MEDKEDLEIEYNGKPLWFSFQEWEVMREFRGEKKRILDKTDKDILECIKLASRSFGKSITVKGGLLNQIDKDEEA